MHGSNVLFARKPTKSRLFLSRHFRIREHWGSFVCKTLQRSPVEIRSLRVPLRSRKPLVGQDFTDLAAVVQLRLHIRIELQAAM